MSAIWGIISRKNIDVSETVKQMDATMTGYKIDRIDHISDVGICMACGHQYITPESHFDVSPIHDEERGIWFTGDVFLTNRDKIIDKLKSEGQERNYASVGDAELAYDAYRTFGGAFTDIIRGSFAIAIYDSVGKIVKFYVDPMGRRYLAYYAGDEFISFGSLYAPIKASIGEKVALNEECLAEYYLDFMPLSFRTPSKTIYQGIYHVNCAECVTVDLCSGTTKQETYYVVGKNVKPLKLKSDDEYKEAFLAEYIKDVNMLLRSDAETAIQLSGGLDSSSVAALACEELAKREKNLYGITIVPATDFLYSNNTEFIENEQFTVEAQKGKHPNLVTEFINGDEGCAFTKLEEYSKLYEVPVKPAMNIDNIYRIANKAASMNCKLILSGANGNASISYGSINYYVYCKLKKLQFAQAYREIKAYCMRNSCSRKKYIIDYAKNAIKQGRKSSKLSQFCFLKDDFVEKYKLRNLQKERSVLRGSSYTQNRAQRYNYIYNPTMFTHMGFFETYSGLLTGTFAVDPTLSVEMVEFILSLPIDCQVKNGRERRTIRDYMEDRLPKCVTSEKFGRGVQTSDAEFRVNRDWNGIGETVLQTLKSPELEKYFDREKLERLVGLLEHENGVPNREALICAVGVCSLGYFLKWF